MSVTYSLSAWPVGILSDRLDRRVLLAAGMVLLIAADLLLGIGASTISMFVGVAVWGLHMGFTQGILAAMVSETSPATLRGTAFGVFNLVSGICMLLASSLAGALWTHFGASTTFLAGAALVVVPLCLCRFMPRPGTSAA
jgi:MFS family permease